jgi:hypothetical protein
VQIYLRGTQGHNKEIDMIGTSRHETEIDELQCDMQRKELYL